MPTPNFRILSNTGHAQKAKHQNWGWGGYLCSDSGQNGNLNECWGNLNKWIKYDDMTSRKCQNFWILRAFFFFFGINSQLGNQRAALGEKRTMHYPKCPQGSLHIFSISLLMSHFHLTSAPTTSPWRTSCQFPQLSGFGTRQVAAEWGRNHVSGI